MSLLGGASGINYYMFFGGTHFAGWGARGMTTSYDYNAAIRENGALGDKYYEAKAIGQFIRAFEPQLVRSAGGPCKIEGGVKSLFGGVGWQLMEPVLSFCTIQTRRSRLREKPA